MAEFQFPNFGANAINAFGAGVNMRRQRMADEQAQAEREAAMADKARLSNTMSRFGVAAANPATRGEAYSQAISAAPEAAQQFSQILTTLNSLDESTRAQKAQQLAQTTEAMGRVALSLKDMPYEQRLAALQQSAPQLTALGVDPKVIASFDPSDQNIGVVLGQARTVNEALTAAAEAAKAKQDQANADRTFAAGREDAAAANRRADMQAQQPDVPRVPMGYQAGPNGTLVAIPGGPGDLRNNAQGFNQENALRDEYQKASAPFAAVNDAYRRLKNVTATPAGDLSLLYSYVKLLDPGSVVRESEFATAETARPVLERYRLTSPSIQAWLDGNRMTPSMRADFLGQAQNMYQAYASQQDIRDKQYTDLAGQYQLNPSRIVTGVRSAAPQQQTQPAQPQNPAANATPAPGRTGNPLVDKYLQAP